MRIVAVIVLLLSIVMVLGGQEQEEDTDRPEPYSPDEFAPFLVETRRFEVILFGSFPFTFLATNIFYDLGRFAVRSISSGSAASTYAPLFFAPPEKPGLTSEEQVGILLGSLTLSFTVALVDLLLGLNEPPDAPQLPLTEQR